MSNPASAPAPGSAPPPPPPEDWRKTVPQSYRSSEVRSISSVLASLEPGATSSSKLMLAMRFEEAVFASASSLADYRKRLTKKLKKMQKNYKPPSDASTSSAAGASSSAPGAAPAALAVAEEAKIEADLRSKYGPQLLFIVSHAADAVETMKVRHGKDRAEHLRQHTDNAEQWAAEINLPIPSDLTHVRRRKRRTPREPGYLDRLRAHLAQRVDNIRSHVVKLTKPDLFLEETLVKLEADMDDKTRSALGAATRGTLGRAGVSIPVKSGRDLAKLLDRATAPIPPVRRGADEVVETSLVCLDRLRDACQSLVGFMALGGIEDGGVDTLSAPKGVLKRSHVAAVKGLDYIVDHYRGDDEEGGTSRARTVKLEDAWNKIMEYNEAGEVEGTASVESAASSGNESSIDGPSAKRLRTSPTVVRSRVLLTPGRKTPSNLLPALAMKGAALVRPDLDAPGTFVKMVFGDAFEMTIYFVPLLVTIRAVASTSTQEEGRSDNGSGGNMSPFRKTVINGGLPTWMPGRANLRRSSPDENASGAPEQKLFNLNVLGATGTHEMLGHIAAEKLQYASSNATRVLRRCFSNVRGGKNYASMGQSSEFEIEISEATALLKFLQIARDTYLPAGGDVKG